MESQTTDNEANLVLTRDRQLKDLAFAVETIEKQQMDRVGTGKGNAPETKKEKASRITKQMAEACKLYEEASLACADFIEDVVDSELGDGKAYNLMVENGYQPGPNDHMPLIPDSMTDSNMRRFDAATEAIKSSLPNTLHPALREHAMFIVSLCNSLMFERDLINAELEKTRARWREGITEIMKIGMNAPRLNYRRHI